MSLLERLAAEIEANGPINVAQYMTACLHDPDFGYYAATEDWLGPDPETAGAVPTAPWLYDSNDLHLANGE